MNHSPESYSTAALLAVTGGFLDAYTFICRDGVFANAQTGNFARLAISMSNGNLWLALRYLIPIFSFIFGVSASIWISQHPPRFNRFRWQHVSLLLEIVLLAMVSCIPFGTISNISANVMVSFTCAIQAESFRKVLGTPFASTMCTGNLRTATEYLYRFFTEKNTPLLQKSVQYFGIDILFVLGAVVGTIATQVLHIRAVLLCCFFLGITFLLILQRDPNTASDQ